MVEELGTCAAPYMPGERGQGGFSDEVTEMDVQGIGVWKNLTECPIRHLCTEHLQQIKGPTIWVGLEHSGRWGCAREAFCRHEGKVARLWYFDNMLDKEGCRF